MPPWINVWRHTGEMYEMVIVHFVKTGGNTLERSVGQLCIPGKYEIDTCRWWHHVLVQWNFRTICEKNEYVVAYSLKYKVFSLKKLNSWFHIVNIVWKMGGIYESIQSVIRYANISDLLICSSWLITRSYPWLVPQIQFVRDWLHQHIQRITPTWPWLSMGEIHEETTKTTIGCLRLVSSLKLWVSFAKEHYKKDYILQERPVILRSLLIVATP